MHSFSFSLQRHGSFCLNLQIPGIGTCDVDRVLYDDDDERERDGDVQIDEDRTEDN